MDGLRVVTLGVAGAQIAAGVEAAIASAGDGLFVGVRLPPEVDPRALLADPRASGVVASYERPDLGFALVAVGEAERVELPEGAGPAGARDDAARLLAPPARMDAPQLRPRLLGAMAFRSDRAPNGPWDGFGCGTLVLPRMLFVRDGGVTGVVVAPGADTGDLQLLLDRATEGAPAPAHENGLQVLQDVDRGRWRASVAAISAEVRAGVYEKAVLACTRELGGDGAVDVGGALARLRVEYPHCHVFSMTVGDATFLGASPELLVGLHEGTVTALGLAGSAERGRDGAEDERLGRALMERAKDRIEHETVVRAIREALAKVTSSLRAPNRPQLRRLRNIQHLATEVTGRALPGVHLFDLAQRLHPTPAVCGWPTDSARAVIAAHEDFDRGWYAGPVGWVDAAGDGELAVALRAALVRGTRAWLFAGNGIMGDSDPDAELAEVELKFRPLAEALFGASP